MFENLTDRLQGIFDNLGRSGKLTEKDVDTVMREVRMALLEADLLDSQTCLKLPLFQNE